MGKVLLSCSYWQMPLTSRDQTFVALHRECEGSRMQALMQVPFLPRGRRRWGGA